MDAPRFDRLARSVASTRSRRHLLRGLAAGAAGLLGLGGRGGAAAPGGCKEDGKPCKEGAQCCSGTCGLLAGAPTSASGACCAPGEVVHATNGACCRRDATTATCAGKCGTVVDNCGVAVDCPGCPACQTCGSDHACHVLTSDPTCAGCCDAAGACLAGQDDRNACGSGGETCAVCSGPTETCFDGHCCTPDCAGKCGGVPDGCGGACPPAEGACPADQTCLHGGCFRDCPNFDFEVCAACGEDCSCSTQNENRFLSSAICIDEDTVRGDCGIIDTNDACPLGTICAAFDHPTIFGRLLCAQPCAGCS